MPGFTLDHKIRTRGHRPAIEPHCPDMRLQPLSLFFVVMSALWLAACASALEGGDDAGHRIDGHIVAIVNDAAISYGEFKQELDSVYGRIHRSGQIIDGTMYAQLKKEVLESLIHLVLMDQYSQQLGIEADPSRVREVFDAAVAKYPSEKAFRQSLRKAGLTQEDILTRIKRTLAAQQVVNNRIEPMVTVDEDEVRAYYDAHPYEFEHGLLVHAAHILIQVNPLADNETRKDARRRIEDIHTRVRAGEDFTALARQYSEDPSSAQGGDIGYFGAAQMAPAFETAAFSLQPGEVSDVVTTQFGYHLIKVVDRKPAGKEPFSEAGPRLAARFKSERLNETLRTLVDKLKSDADIQRFSLDPPE